MIRCLARVLLISTVFSALPAAAEEPVDVSLSGYYRIRGYYLKDPNGEPEDVSRYFRHRVRLEPHLRIGENVALHAQLQALDGVWGANPGNVLTQSTADSNANIVLRRAHGEVTTPVGAFRVGRMGSHWGLGILSNDGDGFRNEWGEAEEGDTYDRVLFVTKPLGEDGPLITGLFYDKILETDGLLENLGADRVREGDVDQYGILVHYKKGHLSAGTYSLIRTQTKTDTRTFIPDLLVRYNTRRFHFSGEAVGIFGKTSAVTALFRGGSEAEIDGTTRRYVATTLDRPPLSIRMVGAAGEAGFWVLPWLDTAFEAGYASGDEAGTDTFADGTLTSYSFDPDYNVGLLMFEYANAVRTQRELVATTGRFEENVEGSTLREVCLQTCANRTRFATTEKALADFLERTGGIFIPTRGSVRNATYLFPKVRYAAKNGLSAIAAVLWAQANEEIPNLTGEPVSDYGVELDGSVAYDFNDNAQITLQGGYFMPGAVFDEATGDPAPPIWTVQPRVRITF